MRATKIGIAVGEVDAVMVPGLLDQALLDEGFAQRTETDCELASLRMD